MTTNNEFQDKSKLELYFLFGFSIAFIIVELVIAIVFPMPTIFQYTVFRIVLALFSAGIAAIIPGVINLNLSFSKQNYIRAGGAIGVFVIIYFYSPASLVLENAPISNDLAAYVFGKKAENQTIAFKSREEANKKNADLIKFRQTFYSHSHRTRCIVAERPDSTTTFQKGNENWQSGIASC